MISCAPKLLTALTLSLITIEKCGTNLSGVLTETTVNMKIIAVWPMQIFKKEKKMIVRPEDRLLLLTKVIPINTLINILILIFFRTIQMKTINIFSAWIC